MENFCSLLLVMDLHSAKIQDAASRVDIIGLLPLEISTHILRLLDGPSLLAAVNTSRHWRALCKGDKELRHRIRLHKLRQNRGILRALQETARPEVRSTSGTAFARIDTQRRAAPALPSGSRDHNGAHTLPSPVSGMNRRVGPAAPRLARRPVPQFQYYNAVSGPCIPHVNTVPTSACPKGLFPHHLKEKRCERVTKRRRLVSPLLERKCVRL